MWSTQAINYLFFVLEAFTIVVAILVVVAFIIAASAKGKISKKGRLEVNSLNQRYQQNQEIIAQKTMSKADFKKLHKTHQAEKKAEHKSKSPHHNVFVIDFSGDIKASETSSRISSAIGVPPGSRVRTYSILRSSSHALIT